MKRVLQSSLFRALTAIAIGVLLVKYPDLTLNWITIAIGVLFLLSGVVSVLSYLNARRHVSDYKVYDANGRVVAGMTPTFPLVGVGSVILGVILVLMPSQFVTVLTYVIGAVLLLGALNLLMALVAARRFARLSLVFWLLPSAILLVGLYFMIKPLEPANVMMSAMGWLSLVYGVTEIINSLKLYAARRQMEREGQQPQVEVFEEITDAEEVSTPQ